MIFEIISVIIGIVKLSIYKLCNFNKIYFKTFPKMNCNFKIAMKKNTKLEIGKNLRVRNNVTFRANYEGKIKIGNDCFFNDNCSLNSQDEIILGNNLKCGQNVMFFDHDHDYKQDIDKFITKSIVVGDNVWIGANSIILKGVNIGNNVVIAAGSIVREDIPNNSMFYQEKKSTIKNLFT